MHYKEGLINSLSIQNFKLKVAIIMATIGLVLVLVVHLWVIGYTYPQVDDLCFFADLREKNSIIATASAYYIDGGGRIIAILLASLPHYLASWTGWSLLACYRALLWLNFGLFFIVALKLSQLMLPGKPITSILRTSLAFVTLFLVTTFEPKEAFFWLSGAIPYMFGLFFFIVVLEFGIDLLNYSSLAWPRILGAEVALVFASFIHELYGIAFILFLGSIAYMLLRRRLREKSNHSIVIALSLGLAIACFVTTALAPGTQSRAVHSGMLTFSGLLQSVGLGLAATPVVLLESLSIGVLLFVLYVMLEQRNHVMTNQPRGIEVAWTALLCTLPASLILGFFATKDPLPGRALNLMHFFVITAITGLGIWCMKNYFLKSGCNALIEKSPYLRTTASLYIFIIMAIVIIFDRGTIIATRDAFVEGPRFARAMDNRFARLQDPATEVVLPPLAQDSRLLLIGELSYQSSGLPNRCVALFFEKSSVRLELPRNR